MSLDSTSRRFPLRALIFFLCTVTASYAFSSNVHGVLMVVKGDVQISSLKDKKTIKAKIGTKIFPGDTIETKKDARAKLVMVDKNIINISPDSKFILEKYEYEPDQNKKGALLNVIYGKVRATVTQKYDGEQNKFQVKTKSSVAGVRGTDFMVSFSDVTQTAKIVTFEGRVEVGRGLDTAGRIMNPVSVTPGQFTVANVNTPPAVPMMVPAEELATMNQQSVADVPDTATQQDGREPSSEGDKKNSDGNESAPASGAASGSGAGGALAEMGEDAAAPVAGGTFHAPASNMLPPPGSQPNGCPNGQCVPLNNLDPSLINGKTRVLININPQ